MQVSHTDKASESKVKEAVALIRELNPDAVIITTPADKLSGEEILNAMERKDTLAEALAKLESELHHHKHHHHYHDEDCDCGCHDHEHHHHHDHDEDCDCGCHGHHHHADEVFTSVGAETTIKYTKTEIEDILSEFDEGGDLGTVLRAKGIVEGQDGKWIHFDYTPGDIDVRDGSAGVIGRLCVIGAGIDGARIKELFGVN